MIFSKINIDNFKWDYPNLPLKTKKYTLNGRDIPFKLPNQFINLLKINNGGDVDYEFQYYDVYSRKRMEGSLGIIFGIGLDKYNLIKEYLNPPEFFPANLVAFGEDGGGNRSCFDYREDPDTDNPPIVYWNHGADEGKDVSFIAKDFEKFLSLLREPEKDT